MLINIIPELVVEIGVGKSHESRCIPYLNNPNVKCHLFEPNPFNF